MPALNVQHPPLIRSPRRAFTHGFTLVELLVVIGILALLMGLLLPTLSAAQQEGQLVKCLSNLRQMVIAANMYADTFDGDYPIASYTDIQPTGTISYNWDFTTTGVGAAAVVTPGLLWMGSTNPQVQQCPSFDGKSNTTADPYTGYNYNTSYIGGGQFGTVTVPPFKMSQVISPSHCAIFGDGQYSAGADKFMRSPFPGPTDIAMAFNSPSSGTQGFRHYGNTTNVAFCDGHAETLYARYTNLNPLDPGPVAPGTGFLSTDNTMYDPQSP